MALVLSILAGCYNVPTPECGFTCGPAGACPSSYACNASTNRCELEGAQRTCSSTLPDAGTDGFPDSPDDFTRPMVIGQFPPSGSVDVGLAVQVAAQFDEDVDNYSSTTFTVEGNGVQLGGPVMYDDASFTISRDFFQLQYSTTYTVTVTSGIIDRVGNSVFPPVSWTFTTIPDTFAPIVTTKVPAVNATDVGVRFAPFADFNEDVVGVTGTSMTLRQGVTPIAGTVAYTVFPFRAIFTPTAQLAENTVYTVSLTSAIEDRAGNSLEPVSWDFTTGPDLEPPIVVTQAPLPSTTGLAVTTNVVAAFDEIVAGVSETSFTLTPQGGSPVAAVVTFAPGTRTATLNPTLQLAANTLHTATLSGAITDAAANALFGAPVSWAFTTGADTFGPAVASISPAPMETGVPITTTIVVEFDEPVLNVTTTSFTLDGGAITGTIVMSAGDTVATFTPDALLPASTLINIELTAAIADAASNNLVPVAFSFTTAP